MKKLQYIVAVLVLSSLGNMAYGQIKGNQGYVGSSIAASSAFLDASTTSAVNDPNFGKGMIYPRADLSVLVLANQGTLYNSGNNPNRFDGMIVYNTGTGNTPGAGSGVGNQAVVPGFYYFSNPGTTSSTSNGRWLPLGGTPVDPKVNILASETTTNTLINSAQVYARKGTFSANGTSTAPTFPSGAIVIPSTGSLYRITIFQAGTNNVYANSVYSYDKTTGNFVTGAPSMSVVYPSGNYDYVVEYTK